MLASWVCKIHVSSTLLHVSFWPLAFVLFGTSHLSTLVWLALNHFYHEMYVLACNYLLEEKYVSASHACLRSALLTLLVWYKIYQCMSISILLHCGDEMNGCDARYSAFYSGHQELVDASGCWVEYYSDPYFFCAQNLEMSKWGCLLERCFPRPKIKPGIWRGCGLFILRCFEVVTGIDGRCWLSTRRRYASGRAGSFYHCSAVS